MFFLPEASWEIKNTGLKGRGVFTKKDILPGTVIGDYIGKIIRPEEEDDGEGKNFYLMYYHDRAAISPDPKTPGLHLFNHSCAPNCWMYTYKGHTLYFALRKIFQGEELTIPYLLSPQDESCRPCMHLCNCESIICSGTMHLSSKRYIQWKKYLETEERKTKKERIIYGKDLPLLKNYPKAIPDNPIYTLFGASDQEPTHQGATQLPALSVIRNSIRQTGRTLLFPKLNLTVYGIMDGLLISHSTV